MSFTASIQFGNFDSLNLPDDEREMMESAFEAVQSVQGGWDILKREDVPGLRNCSFCGDIIERRPTCTICHGTGMVERGFMFGIESHPDPLVGSTVRAIEDEILKRYGGHSGGTYGGTIRTMEFIAKRGWTTYAKDMIKKYGLPKKQIPTSLPPPINTNLPPNLSLKDYEKHLQLALGTLEGSIHSELILTMDRRRRAIHCEDKTDAENQLEKEHKLQDLQSSLDNLRTALDNYFTQVHKFID